MEILTKFLGSQIGIALRLGLFIYLYHHFQIAEFVSFPTLWVYILSNVICFIVAVIVIGLLAFFGIHEINDELDKNEEIRKVKDMFDD